VNNICSNLEPVWFMSLHFFSLMEDEYIPQRGIVVWWSKFFGIVVQLFRLRYVDIILYCVGGTCRVYRLHHSICYTLLLSTPLVGVTIIPHSRFWPPDVLCRGGLLMSSHLERWPLTNFFWLTILFDSLVDFDWLFSLNAVYLRLSAGWTILQMRLSWKYLHSNDFIVWESTVDRICYHGYICSASRFRQ
jgi:hypothetical protein